jgi:hypothetical protein
VELGEEAHTILQDNTCMQDIHEVVEKAKLRYEGSSEKKKSVSKWLHKFSTRLLYYGKVLDVITKHTPQYGALAWGSVKIVLEVRTPLE